MSRYSEYRVVHYDRRADGRISPAGAERLVLTPEEAIELSYTALVVSFAEGFGGTPLVIHEGRHCQFDAHLGWTS